MIFAEKLEQTIQNAVPGVDHMTDGQFTVYYGELPEILQKINVFLDDGLKELQGQSSTPEAPCIAFECPNSVTGALTLFALLQEGQTVVLLPPSEADEQASALRPIPRFCAFRLSVRKAPSDAMHQWLHQPASFLRLESHPDYVPAPEAETTAGALAPTLSPARLMLRTSGSMGASKLVVHDQDTLMRNALNCVEKYHFTREDRAIIPVPIAHMYGMGAELLPAILSGASIDILDRTNLLKYLDRERIFRPTIAFVTPGLCEMLLKGFRTVRTGYKVIVTSGQRISDGLLEAFDAKVGGCLVNQYGSSELGATAACDPGDPLELKMSTVGHPFPGVTLTLGAPPVVGEDRADNGTEADEGELHCRHPYGFLGYVDETGTWLYQAPPQGWYATKDLARRLPGGLLQVFDRAGNSVNRRGYLVALADVEKQLERLLGVEPVQVVRAGIETAQGQPLAAFCAPDQEPRPSGTSLRERCKGELPPWAIPDAFYVLDTLPLLATGKVDRQKLMMMAANPTLEG